MAQTQVQNGDVITLVAPYDRDSGQGAKIGSFFGIACNDVLETEETEWQVTGVHALGKQASQAWTQGDRIYWNDSTKVLSNDSAAGMFVGLATEDVAGGAGDTTGTVLLCPGAEMFEGAQAAIVALTDSTGLSGTHDDTLAATTVPADLTGGEDPTEAEHNALLAVVRVMAQNSSDIAQKVLEIRTALVNAGIIDA